MKKILNTLFMILGILTLISAVPTLIPLFIGQDGERIEVLQTYFSIPFYLFLSLLILLLAGSLLFMTARDRVGSRGTRLVLGLVSVIMVGIGVFAAVTQVVYPLRDIPYLREPRIVVLEDVRFHYDNIGDSPSISMQGIDGEGREQQFSIGSQEYEQGEMLYEQAYGSEEEAVMAQVEYLPYSRMILRMELWID